MTAVQSFVCLISSVPRVKSQDPLTVMCQSNVLLVHVCACKYSFVVMCKTKHNLLHLLGFMCQEKNQEVSNEINPKKYTKMSFNRGYSFLAKK